MMNLIRTEVLLTVVAWAFPVLLGAFLAAKVRSKGFLILLRIVYLPWFFLMCIPFYWFWAGDGGINLLAVPPVFLILAFFTVRYGRSRPQGGLRIFDWYFFSLALAAFLTFWVVVLIHVVLSRPLVVA